MNQVTTVAVDLAKDLIVACAADAAGRTQFYKRRGQRTCHHARSRWRRAAQRITGRAGDPDHCTAAGHAFCSGEKPRAAVDPGGASHARGVEERAHGTDQSGAGTAGGIWHLARALAANSGAQAAAIDAGGAAPSTRACAARPGSWAAAAT